LGREEKERRGEERRGEERRRDASQCSELERT